MTLQEITGSAHNFEECMKCTVCTAYCPVVPVNPRYPGPKQAGPDGERLRLKDPEFFDEALKYCLNCKRCEVVCPSGVNVADIIQEARIRYSKSKPKLRDRILASTDFMGSMVRPIAPMVNGVLSLGLTKSIMDGVLAVDKHRTFPKYSFESFEGWFKRNAEASQKQYKEKVAYFHGCYVGYNFPQLGKDFVKVMNALGIGVELLDKEKCCGVAMISNGMSEAARKNALNNSAAIAKVAASGMRVLATSSTCTFTMRDEYPELLKVDNSAWRNSLLLATRFIYEAVSSGRKKLVFRDSYKARIAYHTPCHLEKLGWGIFSTGLIKMIPGVELIHLDSNCCGIAGTYGFKKENYEASQAIGKALFDDIASAAADFVACDCETCKWQIEMSTGNKVLHPVSILAEALDLDLTAEANK
ncbi:MAG: anaerobic glycerol-3-phosphate dehydrogenase subunit C [Bacteroidales bacterium]|nr:anaerobic glycerol-3-phosphate dehydrogenase subunit C [Bacteroidales bacterium]